MQSSLTGTVLSLAIAVAAGCSEGGDDSHNHAGTTAASCGGKGEQFSAGMRKTGDGGALTFVLVNSDPAPPQIGKNVWTLEIREAGQPVTGATLVVGTRMPVHGHPGAATPIVTELSNGQYELDPVALDMADLWEVSIEVTTPGGTTDRARFQFCIVG